MIKMTQHGCLYTRNIYLQIFTPKKKKKKERKMRSVKRLEMKNAMTGLEKPTSRGQPTEVQP